MIKIQIPALVKSKDNFLIEKLGKFYAKLSVYCSKAQFRFFPSCTMHPFLAHPNSHFGNQHGFDAVFSCCSSTLLFSLFTASDVVSLCSSSLSNHWGWGKIRTELSKNFLYIFFPFRTATTASPATTETRRTGICSTFTQGTRTTKLDTKIQGLIIFLYFFWSF